MSRTQEALKKSPFIDEVLQDQIANTYFAPKSRPKTRRKKTKSTQKRLKVIFLAIPLVFLAAAATITFFILTRTPNYEAFRAKLAVLKTIDIVNDGAVNKTIVRRVQFRGNARPYSRFLKKSIVLTNARKYDWADLTFDFKCPIDLSNRSLNMSLKGDVGGERINVVLRDTNNRAIRSDNISLSSTWRPEQIRFNLKHRDIDLSRITHLRLECGYVGESPKDKDSPIKLSVQIRDLNLAKKEMGS